MKRRSFRFQIALISMGLSGLVLLVFGLVAGWSLSQSQLRSLDGDLKTFGFRFASRSGPGVSGPRQEENLIGLVGADVASHRFFSILDRRGQVLFSSTRWPEALNPQHFAAGNAPLDPQPELFTPPKSGGDQKSDRQLHVVYEPRFYTANADGRRFRLGVFRNASVILVNGADLDQFSKDVTQLRNAFLVALPAALIVIALGAWWLAKKALRPIRVLENDMGNLSARALDQRLETKKTDVEFARIIETYNTMLERLERSFQQANRFSADASHELKTPLAIMRGTLERALSDTKTEAEAQDVFFDLLEQTGRQNAILENLLLLSRADAGKLEISAERINLTQLLETWLEDAGLLAESRNITIHSEVEPDITMNGDPILLQQVAHNLFSNAVRYNRDGGVIKSRFSKTESGIEWTIANTGDPIAAEDRERVFQRFERIQSDENEFSKNGVGLGLSLVKEIVIAHGGKIEIGEAPNGMVEFRVLF